MLYGSSDHAPAHRRVRGLWAPAPSSVPVTARGRALAVSNGNWLVACKDFIGYGSGPEVARIRAGITRIAPDHELAARYPQSWSLGPKRATKLRAGTHHVEERTGVEPVRLIAPGQRDTQVEAPAANVMTGHFAIFNSWTMIDSAWEGRFLERIAPGSFSRTFRDDIDGVRVLLEHGQDPGIGNRPLGPIDELREDDIGAAYRVPLVDGIPQQIIEGLRRGLYGASFRFRVMREEIVDAPGRSPHNPDNLEERTISEVRLYEFGPVTFPAYVSATAQLEAAA
jgi:HK97 family phage prohead protease